MRGYSRVHTDAHSGFGLVCQFRPAGARNERAEADWVRGVIRAVFIRLKSGRGSVVRRFEAFANRIGEPDQPNSQTFSDGSVGHLQRACRFDQPLVAFGDACTVGFVTMSNSRGIIDELETIINILLTPDAERVWDCQRRLHKVIEEVRKGKLTLSLSLEVRRRVVSMRSLLHAALEFHRTVFGGSEGVFTQYSPGGKILADPPVSRRAMEM